MTIGRILGVTSLMAACFNPDYTPGLPCSDTDSCPINQACHPIAKLCVPVVGGRLGAPSCAAAQLRCGAGGDESCCASANVPGGTYYRSYDEAPDAHSDDGYPATVTDFWLDTYEITVGRFRAFVEAGKGTQQQPPEEGSGAHTNIAGSGWMAIWNANLAEDTPSLMAALKCDSSSETWTDMSGNNERRPMNCISWYEAMAFCIWDGGYLPTEAEWNYAAAGGAEQRAYPWSSPAGSTEIDADHAVYDTDTGPGPVGSKSPGGDGRWGHADLAGNASEWTLDWYEASYVNPCSDCANLSGAQNRVRRGGAHTTSADTLRTANRRNLWPTIRGLETGARCARAQ